MTPLLVALAVVALLVYLACRPDPVQPLSRTLYVEPPRRPEPERVQHNLRWQTSDTLVGGKSWRAVCSCRRWSGPEMTDKDAAEGGWLDHLDHVTKPKAVVR